MFAVFKLTRENTQPENMCDIISEKAKDRGGTINRTSFIQKQPSERFFKKGILNNFTEFTRKDLRRNLFFLIKIKLNSVDLQFH